MSDLDIVLDRQAVTVPARHVRCVEAGQRLRAHDDVLEDLVERVTDVQVAVGVGRAVVEHELGSPRAVLADALVELVLLPARDPLRLTLGQVAAHRERGVGQVERLAVVGHGGSVGSFRFGRAHRDALGRGVIGGFSSGGDCPVLPDRQTSCVRSRRRGRFERARRQTIQTCARPSACAENGRGCERRSTAVSS